MNVRICDGVNFEQVEGSLIHTLQVASYSGYVLSQPTLQIISGRKEGCSSEQSVNMKTAIYWQMVSVGPIGVLNKLLVCMEFPDWVA